MNHRGIKETDGSIRDLKSLSKQDIGDNHTKCP